MSKPNIHSLKAMEFTNLATNRHEHIDNAPATQLPKLTSYKPNELAAALHPACQHLKVTEVIERLPDVKSYILGPDREAGTEKLAYFSAGQYLSICVTVNGVQVTRPYSLSSSPQDSLAGRYMLTIKRTEGGLVSQFILDNWKAETAVLASAPLGNFTYEPLRDAKQIIGLAGGSGITPFYSLAQAIADGDEDCSLTLLYGSKSKDDALFTSEMTALSNKCNRIKLVNVYSDVPVAGAESGFITADLIKKYAPDNNASYSVFICGPKAMYNFVDKEIEKLGLRKKFIRHELFGEYKNPERDADYPGTDAQEYNLTVRICGEEQTIKCSPTETLLVSMERAHIPAPARCRSGICGYCHSKLISGNVYIPQSVDGRRLADVEYGYIHPCATFPLSDIVIDVPLFKV